MTATLWKIGTDTPDYPADDMEAQAPKSRAAAGITSAVASYTPPPAFARGH
jgi:hypothetical protein